MRASTLFIAQDPIPPMANPMMGPNTSNFAMKTVHWAAPPAWALATAIRTKITGSTMMSLVPASNFSTWRTERGIRPSRTISLRTTGSVEAKIAPPINAISQGNPSKRASATAPSPMMIPVPGPNTSAGTSHPLPSSAICNLTASRNSTRAKVSVATISRRGLWGPISITPRPPRPSKKPRPRNIIGKDNGDRSTSPDARAVTVRTMAMTPMINMNSGTPHLIDQAIRI